MRFLYGIVLQHDTVTVYCFFSTYSMGDRHTANEKQEPGFFLVFQVISSQLLTHLLLIVDHNNGALSDLGQQQVNSKAIQ